MELESKGIVVTLKPEEAWSVAFCIKNSLEMAIEKHYTNTSHDSYGRGFEGHALPLFKEQRAFELELMKRLFNAYDGQTGDRLTEDIFKYFESAYKKKNPEEPS